MNKSTLQDRRDISSSDFERLLERLDPERNRAGEKYEDLRWILIQFFDWNSFVHAEDLADETLNRVARKLAEKEILDVGAYAWAVAKNIRHEVQNKTRRLVAISELPDSGTSLAHDADTEREIQDLIDKQRQLECMERCLQRLPKEERELFLAYHNPQGNPSLARQRLAADCALTIGALRIKMIRLREKLQKCTERCTASVWQNSRYTQ